MTTPIDTDRSEAPAFAVVRNTRGQYSLLPEDRTAPSGWTRVGFTGTRDACLAQISSVWTDLRPRPAGDTAGDA